MFFVARYSTTSGYEAFSLYYNQQVKKLTYWQKAANVTISSLTFLGSSALGLPYETCSKVKLKRNDITKTIVFMKKP